jgi:hypothetical protein
MTTANSCGDCDLCCRLLAIEALAKPAGPLCVHFEHGCSIYPERPDACRGFRCLWLKSERLGPQSRMGPQWRPDQAHFVMYPERDDQRLNVVVDPDHPTAWTREPYYSVLKRLSGRASEGHELVVYVGDRRIVILPHANVDLGPVTPDQEIRFGLAEQDGQRVPYATVSERSGGREPATKDLSA